MFPRNLTMFRFPRSLDLSQLGMAIQECRLKPVGPLELQSRGFVSPFGDTDDALCHSVGSTTWITIGLQTKILPASVVAKALAEKLAKIEKDEGRKPGGLARKRLKEDLVHELLPRAFVRPGRVNAFIDTDLGIIAVDTSSRKQAEAIVSDVRHALGSFPALPLNAEVAPRPVLTGWVAGNPLPEGLSLGDCAELRDPTDSGAVVRLTRQELEGHEVAQHLEAGKQVARLALTLSDRAEFVFGDDLIIRKFKLLDGAMEALESDERDSIRAEMDARLALLGGELKPIFRTLEAAFRLSTVEG